MAFIDLYDYRYVGDPTAVIGSDDAVGASTLLSRQLAAQYAGQTGAVPVLEEKGNNSQPREKYDHTQYGYGQEKEYIRDVEWKRGTSWTKVNLARPPASAAWYLVLLPGLVYICVWRGNVTFAGPSHTLTRTPAHPHTGFFI